MTPCFVQLIVQDIVQVNARRFVSVAFSERAPGASSGGQDPQAVSGLDF